MKFSEDTEKSTVPGRKSVYRLLDTEGERQLFSLPGSLTVPMLFNNLSIVVNVVDFPLY